MSVSIAIHAALLISLLWNPEVGLRGSGGLSYGDEGPVAGFAPISAELVKQSLAVAKSEVSTDPAPLLDVSADDVPAQDVGVGHVETPEIETHAVPSGGGAPGKADGRRTLLEQIARCLPPNERPALQSASLHISVDGTGNLTAAPLLDVDLTQLTQKQLRNANQVVQAAMQCGPYSVEGGLVSMIDVVPDFTGVPLALE